MNVPILAGVYVDGKPAVGVAYPVNMVPVPGQDGIADGFLRPADGIESFAVGPGFDRGGIVWTGAGNGVHYRVSGTKLISVSAAGVVAVIGDVQGSGPVRMDFSFDRLGILSNGKLWYWNNVTLVQVTDPNIPANLIDMVWVDSYWMVTDGTNLAVSTLVDPTVFSALRYGTTDRPNPVKALLKVLNEVHVVSQNFIDVFQNKGIGEFPFQRVSTAVITKGAIGTRAACVYNDTVAFLGGDRNDAPGVYLASNARTVKISSRQIDNLLLTYTTAQLATVFMEAAMDQGSSFLYVNLPDRCIVYDATMSALAEQNVWHIRVSTLNGFSRYLAQNITRVSDTWVVGDPTSTAIGKFTATDSRQYGNDVRWEFSTQVLRNEAKGALLHSMELLPLTGVVPFGLNPMISTSWTSDGINYSYDIPIPSGNTGDRTIRLIWRKLGAWGRFRIYRFRGDSTSRLSVLSLDMDIKPLKF